MGLLLSVGDLLCGGKADADGQKDETIGAGDIQTDGDGSGVDSGVGASRGEGRGVYLLRKRIRCGSWCQGKNGSGTDERSIRRVCICGTRHIMERKQTRSWILARGRIDDGDVSDAKGDGLEE
jgi:hypothetical protein